MARMPTAPRTVAAPRTEPLTRRGIPTNPTLRVLAALAAADRVGSGALMAILAIYVTRVQHFTAHDVAFAFSCAAVVALVVTVPVGHLADRVGPARIMQVAATGAAVTICLMPFLTRPGQLALVLSVQGVFDRASGGARQAIIPRIATGGDAVAFKAYLRAVTNSAIAVGGLAGGVALAFDTRPAYLVAFAVDVASYLAVAVLAGRLPGLPPVPSTPGRRFAVFRDLPYVAVNLAIAVQCMHFMVLELGVALSLVNVFGAPTWLASLVLLVNTLMCATLQVRMARGSDSVLASRRSFLVGTLWIGAGFVLMGVGTNLPRWWLVACALGGVVLQTIGEMVSSGGQWGIQMGLAPMERQGQYQAFGSLAFSLSALAAPPLVAFGPVEHGQAGWYALAGIVVAAAAVTWPLTTWAARTRERYGVTTHTG